MMNLRRIIDVATIVLTLSFLITSALLITGIFIMGAITGSSVQIFLDYYHEMYLEVGILIVFWICFIYHLKRIFDIV